MTDQSYRVGRKLRRTVYRVTGDGDELIGMMDTPELGALVVGALNAGIPATSAPDRLVPKHLLDAARAVLADRERELFDLKGPCSNGWCRLHYAHSGPCDCRTGDVDCG